MGKPTSASLPLHRNRELPATRTALHNNVVLLDTCREQLRLCAGDEGFDDGAIPAGVDDGDAEG